MTLTVCLVLLVVYLDTKGDMYINSVPFIAVFIIDALPPSMSTSTHSVDANFHFFCLLSYVYRIMEDFGSVFNLAIWKLKSQPSNKKHQD